MPLTRRTTPGAARERGSRELKPIVSLVTVALAKHPAVFSHGRDAFPLRVFARIFALLPIPMRCALALAVRRAAFSPPCAATKAEARRLRLKTLSRSGDTTDVLLDALGSLAALMAGARRSCFCALYAGCVELCEGAAVRRSARAHPTRT
jgi:hypothetical protein